MVSNLSVNGSSVSQAVSGVVESVDVPFSHITIWTIINAVLLLIAAYIVVWLMTKVLLFVSEKVGGRRILIKMVIPLLKLVIWIFVFYIILSSVIIFSSNELFAFSGLLGAAIGFGLKDVLGDIVGGITVILEQPYKVGDKVYFGETYGEVKDIGLRATRVVTPDDTEYSVPNYLIFTQSVGSANKGNLQMMVVIDLFIDSDSDTETAVKVLKEAVLTSKYVMVRNNPYTVIVSDLPSCRRLRAKLYILDLRDEFECKSEITRRAWEAFELRGIRPAKVPYLPSLEEAEK